LTAEFHQGSDMANTTHSGSTLTTMAKTLDDTQIFAGITHADYSPAHERRAN